jgi:hypothetical protein
MHFRKENAETPADWLTPIGNPEVFPVICFPPWSANKKSYCGIMLVFKLQFVLDIQLSFCQAHRPDFGLRRLDCALFYSGMKAAIKVSAVLPCGRVEVIVLSLEDTLKPVSGLNKILLSAPTLSKKDLNSLEHNRKIKHLKPASI